MFLGHDEDMRRRLRIDVFERESVFVFVDFPGGNFTGNDTAKQAIFHGDDCIKR
jgi:hypothetical protein